MRQTHSLCLASPHHLPGQASSTGSAGPGTGWPSARLSAQLPGSRPSTQ